MPNPRLPIWWRPVVAIGVFSVAEHSTWVALLVVAYQRGGVAEAGGVTGGLLLPAALFAPMAARELASARVRRPLALGYGAQVVATSVVAVVLALGLPTVVLYMAGALLTTTVAWSRPAHHAHIARSARVTHAGRADELVRATVATGSATGAAQLLGPLLAAVLLARHGVLQVVLVSDALLAIATALTLGAGCVLPSPLPDGDHPGGLLGDVDVDVPGAPHLEAGPASLTALLRGQRPPARRCIVLLFCLLGSVSAVLGVCEALAAEVSFAVLHRSQAGTGALLAAVGAGLLVGARLAGVLLDRNEEQRVMQRGALIAGLGIVALLVPTGMAGALVGFCSVGVGMQVVVVAGWMLLHRHVCRANTAQVFAVLESQQALGNAIGAIVGGLVVAEIGMWPLAVVVGVVLPLAMRALSHDRVDRLRSIEPVLAVAELGDQAVQSGVPVVERAARHPGPPRARVALGAPHRRGVGDHR